METNLDLELFVALATVFSVIGILVIHHLFFKSYDREISDYLWQQKLNFVAKRKPQDEDWSDSPFIKPQSIAISIFKIFIGGMSIPTKDEKFYVLETREHVTYWVRIETSILTKPYLEFKKAPTPFAPRSTFEIGNQPTSPCPACNYLVIESDEFCPDCGLRLK